MVCWLVRHYWHLVGWLLGLDDPIRAAPHSATSKLTLVTFMGWFPDGGMRVCQGILVVAPGSCC